MNEDIVIPIAGMIMIIVIAIGVPLVIALGKKWQREGESPRVPGEVTDRLARMEQAIDTMAVEIERISEGQRFVTKVLADGRQGAALPKSSSNSPS